MTKVAIDTQTDFHLKSGFGTYVSELQAAMLAVAPDISYLPVQPSASGDLDTPHRLIWEQLHFPFKAARSAANIIHQPAFSAPILHRQPTIITIHDLIPLKFPGNFSWPSRTFFTKIMPFSYRFADRYLTISHHSKKDIIELLHLPADRITVTPLAASSRFHPHTSSQDKITVQRVRKQYHLPDKYFLHIGTLEPRKNIPFLIRAYAAAYQEKPLPPLLLTGKKAWAYTEIEQLIRTYHLEKQIICLGYVPIEDLPPLLAGAHAFLFPSLYEGFGLPPLEAMQSGVPVISSNSSSIPEVVGEAGILLEPTDEKGWSKAILTITDNTKLHSQLQHKGYDQATQFSWQHTARLTAEVYRELDKSSKS